MKIVTAEILNGLKGKGGYLTTTDQIVEVDEQGNILEHLDTILARLASSSKYVKKLVGTGTDGIFASFNAGAAATITDDNYKNKDIMLYIFDIQIGSGGYSRCYIEQHVDVSKTLQIAYVPTSTQWIKQSRIIEIGSSPIVGEWQEEALSLPSTDYQKLVNLPTPANIITENKVIQIQSSGTKVATIGNTDIYVPTIQTEGGDIVVEGTTVSYAPTQYYGPDASGNLVIGVLNLTPYGGQAQAYNIVVPLLDYNSGHWPGIVSRNMMDTLLSSTVSSNTIRWRDDIHGLSLSYKVYDATHDTNSGLTEDVSVPYADGSISMGSSTVTGKDGLMKKEDYHLLHNLTLIETSGGICLGYFTDYGRESTAGLPNTNILDLWKGNRVATNSILGGIKIGYTASGNNVPLLLDANNKAYVACPTYQLKQDASTGDISLVTDGTGSPSVSSGSGLTINYDASTRKIQLKKGDTVQSEKVVPLASTTQHGLMSKEQVKKLTAISYNSSNNINTYIQGKTKTIEIFNPDEAHQEFQTSFYITNIATMLQTYYDTSITNLVVSQYSVGPDGYSHAGPTDTGYAIHTTQIEILTIKNGKIYCIIKGEHVAASSSGIFIEGNFTSSDYFFGVYLAVYNIANNTFDSYSEYAPQDYAQTRSQAENAIKNITVNGLTTDITSSGTAAQKTVNINNIVKRVNGQLPTLSTGNVNVEGSGSSTSGVTSVNGQTGAVVLNYIGGIKVDNNTTITPNSNNVADLTSTLNNKADSNAVTSQINSAISGKADTTYVNTELNKKMNKNAITITNNNGEMVVTTTNS